MDKGFGARVVKGRIAYVKAGDIKIVKEKNATFPGVTGEIFNFGLAEKELV